MSLDLTSAELSLKEIFQITLKDSSSTVLYLTSHEAGIIYEANTYLPVLVKRSTISFNTELKIDTCDITLGMESVVIGSTALNDAIKYGWFDNASISVYYVDSTTPSEAYQSYGGFLKGNISYDQNEARFTATSILDLLNQTFPRLLYQEPCNHRLFDSYCGIDEDSATWKKTGFVGTYTSPNIILAAVFDDSSSGDSSYDDTLFKFGRIEGTSGLNNGISRTIREQGDGFIRVYQPWEFDWSPGDTFNVWAGCDKSGQTCDEKFANYANFFGFEYIPLPEVLYF